MWSQVRKKSSECQALQSWLEDRSETATPSEEGILAEVPAEWEAHGKQCADCRAAIGEYVQSSALLANIQAAEVRAGDFFSARVMAVIDAQEREFASPGAAWTAVPRLAARLTWISAAALLVASVFLYEKGPVVSYQRGTDVTQEALFENAPPLPATRDDVLDSLGERAQ